MFQNVFFVMSILALSIVIGLWVGANAISKISNGMSEAMGKQPQASEGLRKLQINAFLVEGVMAIVIIGLLGAFASLIFYAFSTIGRQ